MTSNQRFWLSIIIVSVLVSFGAQRWGWGQLRRIAVTISSVLVPGGVEDQHLELNESGVLEAVENKSPNVGVWEYNSTKTCGVNAPTAGEFFFDDSFPFTTATLFCIHNTTAQGFPVADELITSVNAGSNVFVQRVAGRATEFAQFLTTATGTDSGDFFTFGVEVRSTNGPGFTNGKNFGLVLGQSSIAQALLQSSSVNGIATVAQDGYILVVDEQPEESGNFNLKFQAFPTSGTGTWKFKNTSVCNVDAVAAGEWTVSGSASDISDITEVCISNTTSNGGDATTVLGSINPASSMLFAQRDDSGKELRLQTTAIPVEVTSTFHIYAVDFVSSVGTPFSNNKEFNLSVVQGSVAQALEISGTLDGIQGTATDEIYLVYDADNLPANSPLEWRDLSNPVECISFHEHVMGMGAERDIFSPYADVDLISIRGRCVPVGAGSSGIDFTECDNDATNCSVVATLPTCGATWSEDDTITGAPLSADKLLRMEVTSIAMGGVNSADLTVCFKRVVPE